MSETPQNTPKNRQEEPQDIYFIDKTRVRASFDRAAVNYDASAILQKQVCEEMLSRLDLVKIKPQAILDLGCGTGHGSFSLQKRFSGAQIISLDIALGMLKQTKLGQPFFNRFFGKHHLLCADIESLPIANHSIGLVWSNLALQWCNDLDAAFNEVTRVLQPNGLFMFSTFGPDTLKELRHATQASDDNPNQTHVSRFIDMHDIGDALTRAGFSAPVLDVERYTLTYDNVIDVMRDLKSIGAHNATFGRARGLQGREFLKNLAHHYEQFRSEGKLPATYEVVFGHAWKSTSTHTNKDGVSPITFIKKYKQ